MSVAIAALIVALAGTAIAAPIAVNSVLDKQEKKKVKNISKNQANNQITSRAPGLSVANAVSAGNADTVDGANAADLRTSSAFSQSDTNQSLGIAFVTVVNTTITTEHAGRILVTASAEIDGDEAVAGCRILFSNPTSGSPSYQAAQDDIGTDNPTVIAVNYAETRPAGTYGAFLQCEEISGTATADKAAINVYGLGA
jgi:hypothetical protein